MQTFLPYPNFDHSVACLDYRRLGKQRVECHQILAALRAPHGMPVGWKNHPATLMWAGYEQALAVYAQLCCVEWIARGYKNNLSMQFDKDWIGYKGGWNHGVDARTILPPPWLGDERFHASHRSALLHKDVQHYRKFNWTDEPKLEYFWPTKEGYNDGLGADGNKRERSVAEGSEGAREAGSQKAES